MKKEGVKRNRIKSIILTILAAIVILFIILPLSSLMLSQQNYGNVALIKIEGVISNSKAGFGMTTVSANTVTNFISQAEKNKNIEIIVIEINSPGGTPVASDEISVAIKNAKKPTVALIRDVGASGGYWIASATDYIFANRMSITGSIGVISSYLEFSKLMEDYGVGYERLVSGEYKDLGVPFKELNNEERKVLQTKINKIHDFFVEEVAVNRNMNSFEVRKLATGEFYLGSEALELGLVDQLGGFNELETYLKDTYSLEKISYLKYEKELGLQDILMGLMTDFSFNLGLGMGQSINFKENLIMI
jgi:protease IV